MDKMQKNKSGNRERDAEGRFVSQNHSNNQSQGQSGGRKGNGGRGRHANGQARDADGRFESK